MSRKRSHWAFRPGAWPATIFSRSATVGLSDRYDEHDVLAEPSIHAADEVLHVMIIERLLLPQLLDRGGVVIDLLARLQRIDRMIRIVRQPEFLDRDANIRVVLEAQLREVFDPLVGQPDGREGEHVHLAGAQGGLGLVLLLRHVPMLDDARAADHGRADGLMVLDAGGLGHLGEDAINESVKAVRRT